MTQIEREYLVEELEYFQSLKMGTLPNWPRIHRLQELVGFLLIPELRRGIENGNEED
jgi:hypothetical protein